mmetsp:Transcript_97468/g.309154  ORF Transcript_97468/g.309154 Transcript_97468/m.309154 type:complete len:451 (+) Transcript_97468:47-1399(+)
MGRAAMARGRAAMEQCRESAMDAHCPPLASARFMPSESEMECANVYVLLAIVHKQQLEIKKLRQFLRRYSGTLVDSLDLHAPLPQVLLVGEAGRKPCARLEEDREAHPPELGHRTRRDADTALACASLADDTHDLAGHRVLLPRLPELVPPAGAVGRGRTEAAEPFLALLEEVEDRVHGLASITKEHAYIVEVEQGVVHTTVAGSHGPLKHDAGFATPDLNSGHPVDGAVGICLCGRVDNVVGPDNYGNVVLRHFAVDVLHLADDVVGHVSLCQEHIHVAGESAGHRVDCEVHMHFVLSQEQHNLGEPLLAPGHGQAVAGHYDHPLCTGEQVNKTHGRDLIHGASSPTVRADSDATIGAEATKQHIGHGPVDAPAHDVAQQRAAGCHECPCDGQQLVGEHEACGARRQAAAGVEQRDDHWHVCPTNGQHHVRTQKAPDGGVCQQACRSHG